MAPPTTIPLTGDAVAAAEPGEAAPAYKNPFLWVPSSYLVMGLVYITVGALANIMFSRMGMPNDQAAFWSSILGFPYTFKFLWAPALELYKTKKFFVVLMQFLIGGALAGVAVAVRLPGTTWIPPVLGLFAITAILGATQDIGTDGVYVTTLAPKEQAKYLGFQSMCWNGGALLANGPFLANAMAFSARAELPVNGGMTMGYFDMNASSFGRLKMPGARRGFLTICPPGA